MGLLKEYVEQQAESKQKTISEWLEQQAANAEHCAMVTHVGRFTNPDVRTKARVSMGEEVGSPYVMTQSILGTSDISASSAVYIPVAKLLLLEVEDGRNVYEHLQQDADFLRHELPDADVDYDQIREGLLKIQDHVIPQESDARLRQVYFPIPGQEEVYHLLTVMPPSSLALELQSRIRAEGSHRREAREVKSDLYGASYRQWLDLTEISIGGTKPQNISVGNLLNGGRLSVLPSVPPQIQSRKVIRPRKDFFYQTLRWKDFQWDFKRLHGLYMLDRNNVTIRRRVRDAEQQIMDKVMLRVYALREGFPEGWSDEEGCHLRTEQQIWLDEKYSAERWDNPDWQEAVIQDFAKWFIHTYEWCAGKEKILLGDGELQVIRAEVRSAVLEMPTDFHEGVKS